MNQEQNQNCKYCVNGQCFANAAVSPEEYDAYQPKCCGCANGKAKK